MRLIELMDANAGALRPSGASGSIDITGLTSDSRQVSPGFVFAALPGAKLDGRAFIEDAIARGASAVLAPTGTRLPTTAPKGVCLIVDDNPHHRFAKFAARFHARQPETVCAVTGTNGKTSVVWFLRKIWSDLGHRAASLGTLGLQGPDLEQPGRLTTPDPVTLHRTLADLAANGVDHLAMEASSHGLAQHRLDGVRITAGAFTNLSRDHLDYHGSWVRYRDAKLRLFRDLVANGGTVVADPDTPGSADVLRAATARGLRRITVGEAGGSLRLVSCEPLPHGQRLVIDNRGRTRHRLTLPLVGRFQTSNALCAAGLAIAAGEDAGAAVSAIACLEPVPGRLQRIASRGDGASVFVDYAHTPDALKAALIALRPHTSGSLVVLFGCGGDRDAGKRPEMSAAAAELADDAIVTDDNPRNEDPAAIRRQILAKCPHAVEIGDRREAIAAGIENLNAGDTLLVAGKGHETGQIVGDVVRPFDDAEEITRAVEELAW